MTACDAMLNTLLDALEDSAAGYAYVARESHGFSLYAHYDFQAFERRRLAALLASRMAVAGSARTSPPAGTGRARCIVNLRIALVHGDDAVIGQLQRNDARLAHMLQASLVEGQLSGEIARTVRSISSAIGDAQAELSTIVHHAFLAKAA